MDIANLGVVTAAESGGEMPLLAPSGAETGAVLVVMGYDADAVLEAQRSFDRAEMKKGRRAEVHDMIRRRRIVSALAALKGWRGFVFGGEDLPFSRAKAEEILTAPNFFWIVEQIERFGGDRANFFPDLPTD